MHKGLWPCDWRPLRVPLGRLFNFHEAKLVDRILRVVVPGANTT